MGRCAVESVVALVLEASGEEPLPDALPPLPKPDVHGKVDNGMRAVGLKWSWGETSQHHAPAPKTVDVVRRVTEIHHLLPL